MRDGAPSSPPMMNLSARNQLDGKVTQVKTDGLMAEITIAVGSQEITSVITRGSVDRMQIKAGDAVKVVIKSTEVMLAK
jgi:molybdopterin-binding protein